MKKNIFFLTIDGLRADKFEGNDKSSITPNLDSLRKKGSYFSQAISCADGTTLSLNAMFTSKFPFRTGTRAKEVYMDSSNFIHVLKNNGYHIYGVIPDLTSLSRFRFSFENNVNSFRGTPPNIEHMWEGTGKKILNLFEKDKMRKPWFCYIHPMDLHDPLVVPEEFDDEKFGNNKYEKVLTSMDEWIGQIIKKIDFSNTLIILTADHGSIIPEGDIGYTDLEPEMKTELKVGKKIMPKSTHKFGAKMLTGLRNKIRDSRLKQANDGLTPYQIRSRLPYFRLSLFDEAIRVPLLFVSDNISANRISQQVTNVDIFPTILDIIGIDYSIPKDRDGRSLVPFFSSQKIEEKSVYLHTIPYVEKSIHDKVGIRTSKYKYFRHARQSKENVSLYDLENDPQENNNIASDNLEIVKEMEEILGHYTRNSNVETNSKIDSKRLSKIQDELRLLGYKKTWKENFEK